MTRCDSLPIRVARQPQRHSDTNYHESPRKVMPQILRRVKYLLARFSVAASEKPKAKSGFAYDWHSNARSHQSACRIVLR